MKYLIMIHSNPASRARWETLNDQQRVEFGRAHYALHDALLDEGDLIASEGLPEPSLSTYVSVRDGQIAATDGPFAEAKEYLAGFYLVDVPSLDDAVAIAARVPDASFGQVEVRPVFGRALLPE